MSDIEKELLTFTGIKSKKGEDRQATLARIVQKVDAVVEKDEDQWDKLSEEAQTWLNAATAAASKKADIEDFTAEEEDEDAAEEEDEADGDDDEESGDETGEDEDDKKESKVSTKKKTAAPPKKAAAKEKAPTKKAATKKSAKPAEKAAPKKDAKPDKAPAKKTAVTPKNGPAPKETGIKVRIKKLLIKKPAMSVDDLMTKLEASLGVVPSRHTVSGIRAEFRHSLHVLKAEGLLEIDI